MKEIDPVTPPGADAAATPEAAAPGDARLPQQAVNRAILCLWLSWALGWLRQPVTMLDPATRAGIEQQFAAMPMDPEVAAQLDPETMEKLFNGSVYGFLGVSLLISAGVVAFVMTKLKRGRDWARIICLIVGVFALRHLLSMTGGLITGLTLANLALGYYALYLLFTRPGSAWFKPHAAAKTENWS